MLYSRKRSVSRKDKKTRKTRKTKKGAGTEPTETVKRAAKPLIPEGKTVRWTWNENTVYGIIVKAFTEPFETTTKEGKTKTWFAKEHRPIYQIVLEDGTLIFKSGNTLTKSTKKLQIVPPEA